LRHSGEHAQLLGCNVMVEEKPPRAQLFSLERHRAGSPHGKGRL